MFAGAAYADDPMVNTYDNTVVTKDEATGATSKLLFNKDMTYTGEATGKDGKPVSYTGTWSLKDDGKTICLTPNAPAGQPRRRRRPARRSRNTLSATAGRSRTTRTDLRRLHQGGPLGRFSTRRAAPARGPFSFHINGLDVSRAALASRTPRCHQSFAKL